MNKADTIPKCPHCGHVIKGEFNFTAMLRTVGMRHTFGSVHLDFAKMVVRREGAPIHLTPGELKICATLIAGEGGYISASDLLTCVRGINANYSRTIDTFVSTIRRKIGCIRTRHGIGYCWDPTVTTDRIRVPRSRTAIMKEKRLNAARLMSKRTLPERPVESPLRIYKCGHAWVPWMIAPGHEKPMPIRRYECRNGNLPPFLALPAGEIMFRVNDASIKWNGVDPLPVVVLDYLHEHQSLPPNTATSEIRKARMRY